MNKQARLWGHLFSPVGTIAMFSFVGLFVLGTGSHGAQTGHKLGLQSRMTLDS